MQYMFFNFFGQALIYMKEENVREFLPNYQVEALKETGRYETATGIWLYGTVIPL